MKFAKDLIENVRFKLAGKRKYFYASKIVALPDHDHIEPEGPKVLIMVDGCKQLTLLKETRIEVHPDSLRYYYEQLVSKHGQSLTGTFVPDSENRLIYWGYMGSFDTIRDHCHSLGLMYKREAWPLNKWIFVARVYNNLIFDDAKEFLEIHKEKIKEPESMRVLMLVENGQMGLYTPTLQDLNSDDWHRIQAR